MTYTEKPNSSSVRFLLVGGWTAIKSATVGSSFAVLLNLVLLSIYAAWQNGVQVSWLTGAELQASISSIALLLVLAILFSTLPAFVGGIVLAWLLRRNKSTWLSAQQHKLRLGSLIGAIAGVILTLLILVPGDVVGRMAHNGIGYNVYSAIPLFLFYAIEIILIATAAGAWTDAQLRKQLGVLETIKTG